MHSLFNYPLHSSMPKLQNLHSQDLLEQLSPALPQLPPRSQPLSLLARELWLQFPILGSVFPRV